VHKSLLAGCVALSAIGSMACVGGAAGAGATPMAAMSPFRMRPLSADGVIAVASEDPTHPRLRYLDGQVSQNSSCAIRLDNKLNPMIPPVYVNGQPIGFC